MPHGLAVIGHFYDRIAVIYFGYIVGEGRATQVPTNLQHDDACPPFAAARGARPMRYRDRREP